MDLAANEKRKLVDTKDNASLWNRFKRGNKKEKNAKKKKKKRINE